jgi:hypothetical protein
VEANGATPLSPSSRRRRIPHAFLYWRRVRGRQRATPPTQMAPQAGAQPPSGRLVRGGFRSPGAALRGPRRGARGHRLRRRTRSVGHHVDRGDPGHEPSVPLHLRAVLARATGHHGAVSPTSVLAARCGRPPLPGPGPSHHLRPGPERVDRQVQPSGAASQAADQRRPGQPPTAVAAATVPGHAPGVPASTSMRSGPFPDEGLRPVGGGRGSIPSTGCAGEGPPPTVASPAGGSGDSVRTARGRVVHRQLRPAADPFVRPGAPGLL